MEVWTELIEGIRYESVSHLPAEAMVEAPDSAGYCLTSTTFDCCALAVETHSLSSKKSLPLFIIVPFRVDAGRLSHRLTNPAIALRWDRHPSCRGDAEQQLGDSERLKHQIHADLHARKSDIESSG